MDVVSAQQQRTPIAIWPRLRSSLPRRPDIVRQPSQRFRFQWVRNRHRIGEIAFGHSNIRRSAPSGRGEIRASIIRVRHR